VPGNREFKSWACFLLVFQSIILKYSSCNSLKAHTICVLTNDSVFVELRQCFLQGRETVKRLLCIQWERFNRFSSLVFCMYYNRGVQPAAQTARLEIISDVVSERHVAEKFRYHIRNTDTTSEIPMWSRKKPMWYRYFRCGIGIFPLRAFSDTTSEIISNRVDSEFKL
jgi:hypothetical protein